MKQAQPPAAGQAAWAVLSQFEEATGDPPIQPPLALPGEGGLSLHGRPVLLAGPWIGELGVSMIRWVPYLRALRRTSPSTALIASGYQDHYCLYRDFCDEYWVLPEEWKARFLNQETPFNYGVFHEVGDATGYRKHAARKGYADTGDAHRLIALQWLREARRRRLSILRLVCRLGEARAFVPLTAEDAHRRRARRLLAHRGLAPEQDRLVMFLPRRRQHQRDVRSWSVPFYLRVLEALVNELGAGVVVLGSLSHESELVDRVGQFDRVVNLIPEGLNQQLAFWELASLGLGPPCGGLVPAYLTGTPLLHWYKPGRFPQRRGVNWNEGAERDYAVFGIMSEWVPVEESAHAIERLVERTAVLLSSTPARRTAPGPQRAVTKEKANYG